MSNLPIEDSTMMAAGISEGFIDINFKVENAAQAIIKYRQSQNK